MMRRNHVRVIKSSRRSHKGRSEEDMSMYSYRSTYHSYCEHVAWGGRAGGRASYVAIADRCRPVWPHRDDVKKNPGVAPGRWEKTTSPRTQQRCQWPRSGPEFASPSAGHSVSPRCLQTGDQCWQAQPDEPAVGIPTRPTSACGVLVLLLSMITVHVPV